jgi:hypothetical protein
MIAKDKSPAITQKAIGVPPKEDIEPTPTVPEDMGEWLKESAWTKPAWTDAPRKKNKKYDDYVLNDLRWRYLRLEGDFRTGYNNYYPNIDLVSARRTISYLQSAREALANDNCDPLDVKNLLDMADQYMTWIYPSKYARTKALALAASLKSNNSAWGDFLLTAVNDPNADIYSAVDITKDAISQDSQKELTNNGLQLERLEMLIWWGIGIIAVMLIGLPMIVKAEASIFKESVLNSFTLGGFKSWIALFTVGVIGAVGAFLSGLLQIRKSKISMNEFKESIIQFWLRPIVGAIFAMLISSLLTWDVVSGIKIENAGAYILTAFLCGFSERYFLNLLKIDDEGNSLVTSTPPPTEGVIDKSNGL